MALTGAQMVTEVLDNLTRASDALTKSGSDIPTLAVRWLNRAQLRIAREEDFLFAIATASTVASTQLYSFPATMKNIYSLRLENGLNSRKLECVMPWQFDAIAPYPAGEPTSLSSIYVPYKSTNTFELYPIPDAVYTLRARYSVWPTDLANDSTASDYQHMDDVILAWATMYGWLHFQEYEDASTWNNIAIRDYKMARKVEQERVPDWAPRGLGFSALSQRQITGEYYNDPLIFKGL